jgi:hypothetical protein
MVVQEKIVVDGLGNMYSPEFVVGSLRLLIHDSHRVGRVVPSHVEEIADVVLLHDLEHARAILFVGFVASGKKRRGWRLGHPLKVVRCFACQIQEVFLDDSLDAMNGAVDRLHLGKFPRFQGDSDHALIDDRCWSAALGDEHLAFQSTHRAGDV